MSTTAEHSKLTYLGVFLLALSTLMLEVLLTRITSVSAWYHLAFFVISIAMLGMTAGAVLVFLRPHEFRDELVPQRMTQGSLGFAIAVPICVSIALSVPLSSASDLMGFIALLAVGGVLALPFVLGGVTLTLALTRAGLPPSLIYGVDLVGAASGCGLVIPLLGVVDAPSAAVIAAALAALAACAFAAAQPASQTRGRMLGRAGLVALVLFGLGALNAHSDSPPLRPAWVKGHWEDPASHMYTGWNSYSRVTVQPTITLTPSFWARGRNTPAEVLQPIEQRMMEIDGGAGTVMARLGDGPARHAYLGWDVTSAVHALRPDGAAAVIGVGGGRDVLEAIRVGHKPVVGIELNDLIATLHRSRMRDFSGLVDLPGVELVSDEARSHLAREPRRFNAITMSLIDTWASTGTGAYSLSENGLYTVQAWSTFLSRLQPGGVFSVSRWYFVDSPGETARMLALAMETIWRNGGTSPLQHIIMLQNELVATLLLCPKPFTDADVDRAEQLAVEKGFNMLATPRRLPSHPLLKDLIRQPSSIALRRWARKSVLDFTPPTDERPFFFNMLRPQAWLRDRKTVDQLDLTFLGNLQATQTLIYATLVSVLLTLLAVAFPMASRVRELRALPLLDVSAALAYFALIGLGFMFVEIGLLSRLSVFLGHPTLALAVLLGGLILFTGVGSLCSGKLDVSKRPVALLYPLLPCALVLVAAVCMQPLMQAFAPAPTPTRIMVSLSLLAIPALGLGLCFPLGLRLSERMEQLRAPAGTQPRLGPWLWGINGAFGVCASGLGLGISMSFGIPTTLLIGALCYALLPIATARLSKSS